MNNAHPALIAFFTVLTCILLVDMFGKTMGATLIFAGSSYLILKYAWKKAEKEGRE